MEIIGKKLQDQYEHMSIKTRYKQYLDPSIEEMKKFCTSLRRNAKEERILFHYNGHGVPLPTPSGEFWVFNKDYTQYIPVSMFDLQAWLEGPSFYVYDVSHAGNILDNFDRFIEKHLVENAEIKKREPNARLPNFHNNIQLAACGKKEMLPTNPNLPADLFTSCLTTPIDISLRYHVLENSLPSHLGLNDVKRVPGRASERRSPMGELNWILTAITDTIAWNALPSGLFKELFRQDLMVAALFRNFLVAQRIMRAYGCHPQSKPEIPQTYDHPLWEAWDLAISEVLAQLPAMLAAEDGGPSYEYQHSTFFADQLTAFQNYLERGALEREAPTQLPIVLQVLLSQVHRMRALILLSKFLDLGPWAVSMALTIGIFPYVVKLLQSPALELRPVMVYIWARIVALDAYAVQPDLLKENGYQYFINIINPHLELPVSAPDADEHRAMSSFVTAMFCRDFPQGKSVCLSSKLFNSCIHNMQNRDNALLRQWSCLCISMLWEDFTEAKWAGIRVRAHYQLCGLIKDPVPEVRAAAIHALTNFIGIPDFTPQVQQYEELIASALLSTTSDGSVVVRKELLIFISVFVPRYLMKFMVAATEALRDEYNIMMGVALEASTSKSNGTTNGYRNGNLDNGHHHKLSNGSVQGSLYLHLLIMKADGDPEIAQNADMVVHYLYGRMFNSPLTQYLTPMLENISELQRRVFTGSREASLAPSTKSTATEVSSVGAHSSKHESYLSTGLRRNASVAAALKYLGIGGSDSSGDLAPKVDPIPQSTQPRRGFEPQRPGAPAEWSTPPNRTESSSTSTKYQRAKVPVSPGFQKRESVVPKELLLASTYLDWCIEVCLD